MLSPTEVTAVIVTRGDVDLQPVLDSLVFDDVEVYDNSLEPNWMTYGRVAAALRAKNRIIYSQDDDLIHTPQNQMAILAAYKPDYLVGCMWQEWSDGAREQGVEGGYDDLVFPGSGSIADRSVWTQAILKYLDHYPVDDFFHLWSDTIIGVIASTRQLDIRFKVLPCAEDETRMCNLPDAIGRKTEAIMRARQVRDGVGVT